MNKQDEEKTIEIVDETHLYEEGTKYLHTDRVMCETLLEMATWKDEQFKQLLIEKTKLLSSSAAQDSVKRCTIEEIYRELFNEEMPNSNPYIR